MTNTTKAQRATITIAADISINAYLLPDGKTVKLGGRNVTDVVNEPANTLCRILKVSSLKDLPGAESFHDDAGYTTTLIPVLVAIDYWSFMAANKGSVKSAQILRAISENPQSLGLPHNFSVAVALPQEISREVDRLKKANQQRIMSGSPEKQVEIRIAKQIPNCQTQVLTKVGQIDILTPNEIIEVKNVRAWKAALGQVLIYGRQYPSHSLRIHLFGAARSDMKTLIESECSAFGVKVTWEG